ncbi:MAG: T9SS type A sorting domain-containing protein [Bacteroidales bacterium]
MKRKILLTSVLLTAVCWLMPAQQGFFLDTWTPKNADAPDYIDVPQLTGQPGVSITIQSADTLTKIPVYMFGDNANAYTTCMSDNKTLMNRLSDRNMGVLRGPSGSISDVYFWNRSEYQPPSDVPEVLMSGGSSAGWPWYGKRPNAWDAGWTMDVDSFYRILKQINVTGMITVNYGYARYGTSNNPVAQAAHMAANWVRYDNGRTRFWEIGNEVYGSWEAGYKIDTKLNKDGQPEIITGKLYGQHCKVFIDSMKAAAVQIGKEIFIGAVAAEAAGSAAANWNVDLMKEIGNDIDYYIIHSYYTPYNQNSNAGVILQAPAQTRGYMNYLASCASQAGMPMKPVALTEYNIFAIGSKQAVSQIGGMFAVMVTGESVKAGLGAICRWDLANGYDNGNDHGMYAYGTEPGVTRFSPRPAFYYLYYMQKFLGDVMLETTVKGATSVKAYSSAFNTGHISTILTNTGANNQTARVNIANATLGNRFYTYTLTGGTDVPADPLMPFSRQVFVNGQGPSEVAGGPLNYKAIKARSSVIGNEMLVELPPYSVVYLLADTGSITVVENDTIYPKVSWNNPADIVYGTKLSTAQLNATANMAGSYLYDPPSGTTLNAGAAIDLEVTFTPNDVSYSPVTLTTKINIDKADPGIQWATPEDIPFGTALGEIQLNAAADVDGSFHYVPPAGTILESGPEQVLQVTFTPDDTTNYHIAGKTVQISIYNQTGVKENGAGGIGIHPVPVRDELTLTGLTTFANRALLMQIMAMDGRVVYDALITPENGLKTINLSALPKGTYLLHLVAGDQVMHKLFVKE